ncbi:MAG: RNA methyltransferase, partial [Erysipelotrichaceae bacterium]|nr:RNA methyltransferase [Erysipelotrichaceae bacterium]
MIVEGAIAVKAAMNSKYRKVIKIYIDVDKHTNDVSYIIQEAYHNRLPVERCSRDMIERMARGRTHGGIVANVSDRRFQSITTMLM